MQIVFIAFMVLASLVLNFCSPAVGDALADQTDSKNVSQASTDAIKIWLVGNPHYGDTPPTEIPDVLKAKAEELGCRLIVEAFKAEGIHNVFWEAKANGNEPDVLVHDCSDILDGVKTDKRKFIGILEKQGVRESLVAVMDKPGLFGGTALLVTSSHNHAKAKEIVAAFTPGTQIPYREGEVIFEANEKVVVSKLAIRAYRDLAKGDAASIKAISDEFLDMSADWGGTDGNATPGIVEILDVRGTNRLAWVLATTAGHAPLTFVFRRSNGNWLLSTLSCYNDEDGISEVLSKLKNANDEEMEIVNVEPPLIVSPKDGARLPRYPNLPDVEWITSGDLAIAYMVESKFFSVGRFHVLKSEEFVKKDVIKIESPFGQGMQPHRWRVWAIGAFGDAVISEWRTVNFTN